MWPRTRGAWSIIGWMLVVAAVGTRILWVVTTLPLWARGSATRSERRRRGRTA